MSSLSLKTRSFSLIPEKEQTFLIPLLCSTPKAYSIIKFRVNSFGANSSRSTMFGHNRNGKLSQLFIYTLVILVLDQYSSVNGVRFGQTHTVQAQGSHQATVVWLHGITENGLRWSFMLRMARCSGIKWIVPTAPIRLIGVVPMTAWFKVGAITPGGFFDKQGLDESVKYAMGLLKGETVKVGVGGYSLGSATTLYTTAVFAKGSYSDGSPFTTKLQAAVALSGWLPGFGVTWRGAFNSPEAKERLSLPILQVHGTMDVIVPFVMGKMSNTAQKGMGFVNLQWKQNLGRGHLIFPGELMEMCSFYKRSFGISG